MWSRVGIVRFQVAIVESSVLCQSLNRSRFVLLALGWRRSHRPSLYDISIIDEVEERDDAEDPDGASTDGTEAEKEQPISAANATGAADEKSKEASRGVPLPVYSSVTK